MKNKKDRKVSLDSSLISRKKLLTSLGLGGMALLPSFGFAKSQRVARKEAFTGQSYFNVKDYGAVGNHKTDDSNAFQDAVDAIAREGSGVLYVPSGSYRLNKRISKSIKSWSLAIKGDGQGVSNIYCNNKEGVFEFNHQTRSPQITIQDLSFFSELKGGGTAIQISQPGRGNLHHRSLIIQNVEMRGANKVEDYFDYGIKVAGQWRPLFLNVIFAGPFGPGAKWEDIFQANCGIEAVGTYAPSFQNCYMWSAKTGYRIKSTGKKANPEDTAFYRSFAVQCNVGMDIYTSTHEPQLEIDTCHINCWEAGIRLHQRKYFSITNCLMYNVDWDNKMSEYNDIILEDSFGGIITDNIFHQPANNNRANIEIKGTSYDIQIKDNLFNAKGTAVAVASEVTGIIVANNQYTDQVTHVLDDSSSDLIFESGDFRGVGLSLLKDQQILDDSWTYIKWEKAEYDSGNFWTNSDQMVIPSNKGIHYVRLTANINWQGNKQASCRTEFRKNGRPDFFGNVSKQSSAESQGSSKQYIQSSVIPVKGGDFLQVYIKQESSQTLYVKSDYTWFSVEVVDG